MTSPVGIWHLTSWTIEADDGSQTRRPFGEDCRGIVIYTPEGWVSVHIQPSERAAFGGTDLWSGTDAEKAAALDSYIGYSGTYEWLGDRVVHHVQFAMVPYWVGTDLNRDAVLDGDELTLSLPRALPDGRPGRSILAWRRHQV